MLHRVKDLSADQKLAAEALLGYRLFSEGESLRTGTVGKERALLVETQHFTSEWPAFREQERFDREAKWLSENRQRFAGQGIALDGDTLLASGPAAKDVFSRIAGHPGPPLVIRIESENLPFGGW